MKFFEIQYRHGKKKESLVLETFNKLDAMKKFQKMELGVVVKMKEINEPLNMKVQKIIDQQKNPIKKKRIPIETYIAALRQLSVMLDAGMPINLCLGEVIKSTQEPMLKAILTNATESVEEGAGLTDALKPYSTQLGNLSISMIHLGEQTGTLAESIDRLSEILQNIHDNRIKLKKATRYPLITIIAMSIAFTVVITFVVPQFEELFRESKTELPFPTLVLLWLENAISTYGPYILVGAVFLASIYSYMYKKSEALALKSDRLLLKVYIVGAVTKYAMLGRFVYIFNVLVHAGIPIVDALKAATGVVDNLYMKQQFNKITEAVEEGRSLHEGFASSNFFESMILQMLKAGEDAGALNVMLDKITTYYNA
ncbi:MAG: type II secretion system F family protein, partial [Campylobacterota bacterium]|nr:type II secretion system F family protein [Campylobacterota bacterium]